MSRQARTARIGFYTAARGWGGAQKYLCDLLLAGPDRMRCRWMLFCRRGYPAASISEISRRVDVIYLDGPPAPEEPGRAPGTRRPAGRAWRSVVPKPCRTLAGAAAEARRLAPLLRSYDLDLLHFNDTGCEPAVVAARMARIPAVTGTLHALPGGETAESNLAHRCIEHVSIRCMDLAIAVSGFTGRAWIERTRVSPARIRVIYNGIDLETFKVSRPAEEVRAAVGVPEGCRIVGMTARLHPMKGHVYLLRALPEVLRAAPDVHVVLTGDGGLRQNLEQAAREARLTERVHFLGHRADVADVTQLYDIAVLPSVALECLPYTLIEAMSLGKPVVASRFSGIPEVVDDGVTGTLVPPRAPGALADAMVDLLSDPQKARSFGEAGRRRVEERFTLQRMIGETVGLFRELLNRSRAARRRERVSTRREGGEGRGH